ncbi:MAG: aromatic acid exporter family protein [Hespellia sp.]|nr:aromatic acid exporter family protein [Hespellia sp.]
MKNSIKNWFQTHINKHTTLYALRITIGIVVSILIAEIVGIQFAPSTGVVMLLSLQTTRKETLKTIFRKILSLGYTLFFAILIHEQFGTNTLAFSVVILLMVVLSIYLGWYSTLSVNVVIAVHLFITQEPFTHALMMNEIYRVCIGIGIAFLINLGVLDVEKQLTERIADIEDAMKAILNTYADYLDGRSTLPDMEQSFRSFRQSVARGQADSLTYANNHLFSHAGYYENYMNMRENDALLLEHIYLNLKEMADMPAHSGLVADFARHISDTLHIERSTKQWTGQYQEIIQTLDRAELPSTRSEFHAQANLLYVFYDLAKLLEVRNSFLASVSPKQREKYLKS